MKKLIIAIAFGLLSAPLYAEEDSAASLKAKLEALQQQLAEQEAQAKSLQQEYEHKQTASTGLQGQVDSRARLIELLKQSLNQTAEASPPESDITPVAATDDDDDDDILEIELIE